MPGRLALSVIALFFAVAAAARVPQQPVQRTPVFRASALIVPVDLRVLDRNGQPVTDLKADEIEIREDGVRQEIKHFSARALSAERDDLGGRLARRQSLGSEISPQSRRVFLIVLGRGRLQYPAKGVDAVLRFVRERLLPQDLVAVFAYDRATAFTTDHLQIAETLERYRARHEGIEQLLRQRASGLGAVYGNKDLPEALRTRIDAVFQTAVSDTRELASAPVAHERRLDEDMGDPFDQFISANRQTMQDLGNLYTGIEYLRHIDGEKHLIFVTEQGLNLPRLEDETSLAAIASDARVAIDPIQTGGVVEPAPPPPSAVAPGSLSPAAPQPNPDAMWRQTVALMSMRAIADLTGGQASMLAYAEGAIDRINASTRFGYLLGYSPTNPDWNGRYRRIQIAVRRPDVTPYYRHGYYGREDVVAGDRKQFLITSRMNAAVGYRREIRDLRVTATAREAKDTTSGGTIDVAVTIDAARVRFDPSQNQHVATLYVALVGLDTKQLITGQTVEQYIVRYDDAGRAQVSKDGITYTGRVTPRTLTPTVKVVVYDYAADLLGTVVVAVRN
jgi:VWFA-related protein